MIPGEYMLGLWRDKRMDGEATPAWMPIKRELKILLLEDAADDAELIVHTLKKSRLVFESEACANTPSPG